jgi:proteasome lid subunit RPN8/RPN11
MTINWDESNNYDDIYKPIELDLAEFLNKIESKLDIKSNDSENVHRSLEKNKFNVFMNLDAEKNLKKHLSIDPRNETGGVIVGQAYYCKKTKIYYTKILGAIPALHTVGNVVHFTFTAASWQSILRVKKQDFPTSTIVGWYHSHPGHGIFLSGVDLNTQRTLFNKAWDIAIVYDPQRKEIGYFYSIEGKPTIPIYFTENKVTDVDKSTHDIGNKNTESPVDNETIVDIPAGENIRIESEGRDEVSNEIDREDRRSESLLTKVRKFLFSKD